MSGGAASLAPYKRVPKKEETARIMRTVSSKWPHQDGQGYVP